MDLSRFTAGLASTQALADESERVLHSIAQILTNRLEVTPGIGDSLAPLSLLDAPPPVVTLRLYPRDAGIPADQLHDHEVCELLQSFTALITYSQRLSVSPELKRSFWERVPLVVSDVHARYLTPRDVARSSLTSAATDTLASTTYPRFAVACGFHYKPSSNSYELVSDALGDALIAFMTTPLPVMLESNAAACKQQPRNERASVGFSFANCALTAASLTIVERIFDQIVAHPKRPFAIGPLDLSDNIYGSEEAVVLARLARKCSHTYNIPELKFTTRTLTRMIYHYGYIEPVASLAERLAVVRAAFGFASEGDCVLQTTTLAHDASVGTSSRSTDHDAAVETPQLVAGIQPRILVPHTYAVEAPLRSASFIPKLLPPDLYAAHFSALRYRCTLQEDHSVYMAWREPSTHVHHRWLAFGLFYPRPQRFADAVALQTLGYFDGSEAALATYTRMLQNPVAELVYPSDEVDSTSSLALRQRSVAPSPSPPTSVMVCVAKQHAVIEVIERSLTHPRIELSGRFVTLATRTTLEALYERADGAVCVVVPGIGLGWLPADDVDALTHESLEQRRAAQAGRLDVRIHYFTLSDPSVLRDFLVCVGFQIGSIALFDLKRGELPLVLEHCPHLKQLTIGNIVYCDLDVLLDAMRGDVGRRLIALNLNGCRAVQEHHVLQLVALLGIERTDAPLQLRELRIRQCLLSASTLMRLHAALDVNTQLEVLEITPAVSDSERSRAATSKIQHSPLRVAHGGSSDAAFATYAQRLLDPIAALDDPIGDIDATMRQLIAAHHNRLLQAAVSRRGRLAFLSVAHSAKHATGANERLAALEPWHVALIFAFAGASEVRRRIIGV